MNPVNKVLILRIAAVLAWLAFFGGAQVQEAVAAPAPAASCPPVAALPSPEQIGAGRREARDRGFLWRISRDGRSSYLYGTVHAARLGWMFPGPRVAQALADSQTVALELDMLDTYVQQRLAQGMASHRGAPLPREALQRVQGRLQRQMRAQCLGPEQQAALGRISPEMQLIAMTVLAGRHDGIDPAYGIDTFLAGYARGLKKRVVSLETPEDQLNLFDTDDPADQLTVLERGLADLESGHSRGMIRRIAQLWADSDQPALARYEEWCGCLGTAAERALMKRMLDGRNPALAQRIDTLHRQGPVFAAVGSLHMIGAGGLPALMAEQGYRVERVAW
jgi:uncharacterized protein